MSYLYELHAHCTEVSPCGGVKAEEVVALYKAEGYQGLVLTDHYHHEYFSSLGDLSWKGKTDKFLEGYRLARKAAEKLDFDLFLGFEIRFTDSGNDFLVFGVNEDFLYKNPRLYEHDLAYLNKVVKRTPETLIVQAHPFRKGCKPSENLSLIDGVEICNGNPRHDSRNSMAAELARENNLLKISGSDFHRTEDLGKGGIRLSKRVKTSKELIRALNLSKCEDLICQESHCH
ncbi:MULTISPECIES: PHP domain-containing protein [unclassified Oceanispirochaeta]|uniref:PHP domain-containing protein n=1 Tax=unclassified Oceanispirochaeta TaxID=2635722 RepID=UPI000E09915E|nr:MULTISPECIES: PHP domain-containing protein [unclassified Oceanispirochaeta]MBF9017593.1 PHP domain-containing protein [Oceanispirochaeta sp. M2]NPD74165.1 PHP domain-containing protein [Oceanispirochaeta sp. M1]RDG29979.1 PHP domain-containing protein [Oceanispirochaeta sp. M1]